MEKKKIKSFFLCVYRPSLRKFLPFPFLKTTPKQLYCLSFIPTPEFCSNAVQACHHFQNTHRGSQLLGLDMEQKTGLHI